MQTNTMGEKTMNPKKFFKQFKTLKPQSITRVDLKHLINKIYDPNTVDKYFHTDYDNHQTTTKDYKGYINDITKYIKGILKP